MEEALTSMTNLKKLNLSVFKNKLSIKGVEIIGQIVSQI